MSIATDPRVRVRAAQRCGPRASPPRRGRSSTRTRPSLRDRRRAADDARRRGRARARVPRHRAAHVAPPPAGPRRRSSRSRCSGRGCRRAPRGSRRRSASGLRASRSAVATTRPGRAEAALHRAGLDERLLHRCSSLAVGEPLDRDDLVAVGLRREHEARADERPVEQHRARAALALLARVLRARQPEPLAQREEQRLALPDVGLALARR